MKIFKFMLFFIALFLCCIVNAEEIIVGNENAFTISDAIANAQKGDTVYIPKGIYSEKTEKFPIIIDKPIKIIGEKGTILQSPPFIPLIKVEAPDVTIENIEFHLLRWGIVGLDDRLTVNNCNFILSDSKYRVSSAGIWLSGAKGALIKNNKFTECSVCLSGPPISEESKNKPVLTGLFEVGEDKAYFSSHTFIENHVNNKPLYYFKNEENLTVPKNAGQVIVTCSNNVNINEIDVSRCSMGLIATYCNNVSVSNIKANDAGLFGVYFAYVDHGAIEKCFSNNSNHAMDFRASKYLSVNNCTITNCEQGIFFSNVCNSQIYDCTVNNTGQGYFFAVGNNNTVSNSYVVGCENGMNFQKESDISVINCLFKENTVCALRMDRSPSAAIGNKFCSNWVDIMAYGRSHVLITNNLFKNSISCGIYIRDLAYSHIIDNTFDGFEDSWIQMQGEISEINCMNNEIKTNIIE